MIGLVMAGGRGTRMDMPGEKLLLGHKKPVILQVVDALKESQCFSKILAATSDHSPRTGELLMYNDIETIKTKGDGYVDDLNFVLSKLDELAFVVSGDLPLLDSKTIRELVARHKKDAAWQSFVMTKKFLDLIDVKLEFAVSVNGKECYYTGISIVDPKKISNDHTEETLSIFDDKKIAVNLNTKEDYYSLKNS
ncbi:MAG: NTP transferase domain-containing protein [Candidatus Nitrosotenuis sp.]